MVESTAASACEILPSLLVSSFVKFVWLIDLSLLPYWSLSPATAAPSGINAATATAMRVLLAFMSVLLVRNEPPRRPRCFRRPAAYRRVQAPCHAETAHPAARMAARVAPQRQYALRAAQRGDTRAPTNYKQSLAGRRSGTS